MSLICKIIHLSILFYILLYSGLQSTIYYILNYIILYFYIQKGHPKGHLFDSFNEGWLMAIDTKDYPNKIGVGVYANNSFDKFYYVFSYNKKKYRGLIDFSDRNWNKRKRKEEALFKVSALKKEKELGMGDGRVLLDKYFYAHYELRKETAWVKTLVSHYRRYVSPTLGKMKLEKILNEHIKEVLKSQYDKGLSDRTIKQTLEALSPVFADALSNRIIVFNPLDGVKVQRPNTKKIVTNASHEVKIIYNGIIEEFANEPYYKAFYLFALQGRRKSEIMTLLVEDVSFEHGYYILRDVKNREHQKMHLSEELADLLIEFMDKKEKYVFYSPSSSTGHIVNVEKVTARLRKRIGKRFTLHYMRNVVVSAMAEMGASGSEMGASLGHNNMNTLSKYLTMPYQEGSRRASEVIDEIVRD